MKKSYDNKYCHIFMNIFNIKKYLTLLVQLVERRFPKPDVVGSSPTGRELFFLLATVVASLAQLCCAYFLAKLTGTNSASKLR